MAGAAARGRYRAAAPQGDQLSTQDEDGGGRRSDVAGPLLGLSLPLLGASLLLRSTDLWSPLWFVAVVLALVGFALTAVALDEARDRAKRSWALVLPLLGCALVLVRLVESFQQ